MVPRQSSFPALFNSGQATTVFERVNCVAERVVSWFDCFVTKLRVKETCHKLPSGASFNQFSLCTMKVKWMKQAVIVLLVMVVE